jgi:hypothetical protein
VLCTVSFEAAQMRFVKREQTMAETWSLNRKEEIRFAGERISNFAAATRPSDFTVFPLEIISYSPYDLARCRQGRITRGRGNPEFGTSGHLPGDSVRAAVIGRLVKAQLAGRSDSPGASSFQMPSNN